VWDSMTDYEIKTLILEGIIKAFDRREVYKHYRYYLVKGLWHNYIIIRSKQFNYSSFIKSITIQENDLYICGIIKFSLYSPTCIQDLLKKIQACMYRTDCEGCQKWILKGCTNR